LPSIHPSPQPPLNLIHELLQHMPIRTPILLNIPHQPLLLTFTVSFLISKYACLLSFSAHDLTIAPPFALLITYSSTTSIECQ
jgi:hypothetical protein